MMTRWEKFVEFLNRADRIFRTLSYLYVASVITACLCFIVWMCFAHPDIIQKLLDHLVDEIKQKSTA